MKLYLKQKVFPFGDKFFVYDVAGNEIYTVKGEVFSFGKKLHVYDNMQNEVAFIKEKVCWSFLPKYYIIIDGKEAEMRSYFTVFKPHYTVDEYNWDINGNFWAHDYTITKNEKSVAIIAKKWFTWGDTYEIDVANDGDTLSVLGVALAIDAILDAQSESASTSD